MADEYASGVPNGNFKDKNVSKVTSDSVHSLNEKDAEKSFAQVQQVMKTIRLQWNEVTTEHVGSIIIWPLQFNRL